MFFQQILTFSTKFKAIYISEFLSYTNDQVVKKHLHDQENASGNISWPRAHFRARCARLKWALGSKISHFVFFHNMSVARGARARSRARPKLWNSDSSWKVEQKHTWTLCHQIAQNRVKVATDANIFEDKTFFEVPLKNFLLTSWPCSRYLKGPSGLVLYVSKKIVTIR